MGKGVLNRLKLVGYDKLGVDGQDGIRCAWSCGNNHEILESAAFIYKTKGVQSNVSGYTTSVSLGCILRQMGMACKFCRTGMLVPYRTHLTSSEIAKQNVFMVLTDMNCDDNVALAKQEREFAYMGQGEPGFSYPQVRDAIRITDEVMLRLGQKTFRHIYSTSGIEESLKDFCDDLEHEFFPSKVTLHYSLHGFSNRSRIMPIEDVYTYKSIVPIMERISRTSGEKVSLGLLLFGGFKPKGSNDFIKTSLTDIKNYCHIFNPDFFRFSLCEFNDTKELGDSHIMASDDAVEIYDYLVSEGFETKRFFSFGKEEYSACGMLAGKMPDYEVGEKWQELEIMTDNLISNIEIV